MSLDYQAIGKRLKEAREKMGLKQKEIAALINATTGYATNVENGKKPSLEYLVAAAEKCNVSLDWILNGCDAEYSIEKTDILFDEYVNLYKNTPKDARALLIGIIKTVIQNSAAPKDTTLSTSQSKDGSGESNIA